MQSWFGEQLGQHGATEHVVVGTNAIHGQHGRSGSGVCQSSYHMLHAIGACPRWKGELERSACSFHFLAELPRQTLRHQLRVAITRPPSLFNSA